MAGPRARWMRLGLVEPLELHATTAGLAAAQPVDGAPIVLWARAKCALCLGQSQTPANPEPRAAVAKRVGPSGGALVWVDENQYVFVLIAPRRHAPGRPARWGAWALAPAIATYRQFGLRAYQNGDDLWLDGRRIAGSAATAIGACAVVASSFLPQLPLQGIADRARGGSTEFRSWLREGLSLAMTEWAAHGASPTERELEEAFRARQETQYGWRFENDWPSDAEAAAISEARDALAEPVQADLPGRY